MNKIFAIIISILLVSATASAAETAPQLLQRCAAKITKASGVSFSFSATGEGKLSGSFKACGEKFAMSTTGGVVWYNGKYMWTYSKKSEETTRVVPSAEEIAETNPVMFIAANYSAFDATYGKAESSDMKVLILTPKNRSNTNVERAVLTVNASTLAPVKVAVRQNGNTTVVKISNFKLGGVYPESAFTYPKSKYPGVPVINL